MSSPESREELARFLRARREQISPAQVGLPEGPRRRTKGLRREEVAVLAGLSPTWYTYLEQARNVRASAAALDSLADVLALSEDERRYLHQLARPAPPPSPPKTPDDGFTGSMVHDLVRVTGAGPYPVYVLDYMGNVIAWNDAAVTWYTDWEQRGGLERNMVWWLLTDPEAKDRIVDWDEDARDIVARTRAAAARYPHDRLFHELITKLHRTSADFRQWWDDHEVRGQRLRLRRFRLDDSGRLHTIRLAVVHPHDDPSITIAFHLPEAM